MLGHRWISRELNEEVEVFWFDLLPKAYQDQWPHLGLWKRGVLRWAVYVTAARKAHPSEKYLEVNYEEICQAPQQKIYEILDFLALSPSPELENRLLTIQSSSVRNWQKKALSKEQKHFYEKVLTDFAIAF
jgi:hypothetical protein